MKKKDGYVIDTTYPKFFYKEMQPLWLNTVINFLGFKTPNIESSFSYLELACATGTNLLVCAINNPQGYFVGIDFNEEHIKKAKAIAEYIGLNNVEFIHCDFSFFLENNNSKFDFIVNHGTFSWVSPTQQSNIFNIAKKYLNDSGVLYLHYMCYPGSTPLQPVQKLLSLVDENLFDSSLNNIEIGKKLFFDLNDAGTFIHNPQIERIIKALGNSNSYLAHEFLTDYWQPLYSVDVHKMVFNVTKMTYLGSANPCNNIDNISIPSKTQNIIKNIQDPALKEYLKDLARDSKQRVDIFQKKPKVFNNADHINTISKMIFKLLPHAPKSGGVNFQTPIGEIKASKEMISPLLECLAKKERKFSELLDLIAFKNNPIFLIESIFLLMDTGYLYPVLTDADHSKVKKFNEMMQKEGSQLRI